MKQLLLIVFLFNTIILHSQQFDIPPFPGEEPEKIASKRNMLLGQNNWGEDLLLPESLISRLNTECTFNVVVKVFDTGAKYNHTDLVKGQITGANYCQPKGSDVDVQGHSTHVAGIIASQYLGLARTLVESGKLKFKPVKVLNDQGSGNFDWVANAVKTEDLENKNYLAQNTFVVVNMSLGGGTVKYTPTQTALKASKELGVIYCIAAGNTGTLGVNYPGNSEHVIGVGSLDQTTLKRSSFSTFGPEVWMAEPGRSINSTYLNNTYATLSGTSMATPFQSALCAIALSKWGKVLANTETMKKYLAWVATDITPTGKDNETGYGYLVVKSILDKNPKDIPTGGPVNPPTPPNPPTKTARDITFNLNVNYNMAWSVVGATSNSKKYRPTLLDSISVFAAGLEVLTITKIKVVSYKSTLYAQDEAKKMNAELSLFFNGRGLVLDGGSDYADATYWSAYFLDLILKTQRGYDVDVLEIEGKDQNGNSVFFSKEGLKKF